MAMDLTLNEQQIMLRNTVASFAEKELKPIAEEIDREAKWPAGMWKKLSDLGIMGISIDPEYGGSGCDVISVGLVNEELGKVCPAVAMSWATHANLCSDNLNRNANAEQKKKYLPSLASGEHIGALGLTEPNAGSDAVNIQTSARKDGDHYVINGSKMFITNGPVANTIIVYTKTDKSAGAKGITSFILDTKTPGFSVSREIHKVGHRASQTAELVFEDCRIPAENVLGQINRGVAVLMSGLDVERTVMSFLCLGVAEAALAEALKYSKERVQFGKPIGSFQLIQAKLADMYTQIEAARLLCYSAAITSENTHSGGKGTEVHLKAAAAILFAGEVACKVCDEAVQIHGGYGYCLDYPVQRFWRDARLGTIGAGTSEMRRLIIGRELTNM
jgi:isovaleryl-CoA dehydrogenase